MPATTPIQVVPIGDRPDAIPTVAQWYQAQWPDCCGARTTKDIERDFQGWMNRDRLPVGLVAYQDDEFVGSVVLRERALRSLPDVGPGLGGLIVSESYRRRGVG